MIFTNDMMKPGNTQSLIQANTDISRAGFTTAQPAATAAKSYATNAASGVQAKSDHMWNDAAGFNSTARQNQEVGKAVAGVTQTFGQARDAMDREAASLGLDPNSAASTLARARMAGTEALGKAQTANTTRMGLDDEAWKRKMAAAGLGLESAKTGTELAMTPLNVDNKQFELLRKGFADSLDASLKADSNETSRMSASAAASNAATNASLAGGRLALERDKFDFDKDQTLWARENLTPWQIAQMTQNGDAQTLAGLTSLARFAPVTMDWLKQFFPTGPGSDTASTANPATSAAWTNGNGVGLDTTSNVGYVPGGANGQQDIDPGPSYTPGLEDTYYIN
jgi:hypothetical protein